MKISEIPVKNTITSSEINNAFVLGMKNIYPDDNVPVYELQKFPLSSYLTDTSISSTKMLVEQMRTLNSKIDDKKDTLQDLVSNVKTITSADVENANLQKSENVVPYKTITSQLTAKFATPEDLQTSVNNVYTELFKSIEEMLVQVFTTSMYARQYTQITDDVSVNFNDFYSG